MEIKSTDELSHEIKAAKNIKDYLQKNKEHMIKTNLSEHLNMLLSLKKLKKADVVRASLLDRTYVYKIFAGEKNPTRDKLIALAFGLHLSDLETQKMLKLSDNRELYARDERDALILFSLQRNKTVFEVNELLIDHELSILS